MKRTSRIILAAGTAILLSGAAWPAIAQEAAPAPRPVAKRGVHGLEEIVVTAQRVAKNLQKTPVAVTSLTGTQLKDRGVSSLLDLSGFAPNLSIGTRAGTGAAAGDITIRGIGINANPPASPSVGIYIDDVYFPGNYGNLLGLFDVARVEVLRGPQGTLFGRNTIAGAIQYVTVKPQLDKYNGYVEGTVGNLGRGDLNAAVNVPLGSIAALRVEGAITNRDGYLHDDANDVNRGSDRVDQARVQLRIEPNSDLTIDIKGEYFQERSNGPASDPIAFNYSDGLSFPFAPNHLNQYIARNFYSFAGDDGPVGSNTRFQLLSGIISYKLTDDITLKSISAYSANTSLDEYDQDGTPLPLISVSRGDTADKLFTQELQLNGRSFNSRLHWTVGGYYYDDRAATTGQLATIFGQSSNVFGDYTDVTLSYAAYGQATFDLTRKLSLVGGLRYTNEQAKGSDDLLATPGSRVFTDVSPMFGLNYQLTPDIMFYFKDSRGFRAGGFSPNAVSLFYFAPEDATTYEFGSRMEFLGKRLRVNPTIFQTQWNNIQFNANAFPPGAITPIPIIENAGDARIRGAEIETEAAVTDNVMLTASGSLLDGKYTTIAPALVGAITYASALARSPNASFAVGGHYDLALGDQRSMTFALNYAWQAHQRSQTTDTQTVFIPSYGLLNGRIVFKPFGERFSVALFATNLTGEKYIEGGTDFGTGGLIPTTFRDIGQPREYGLTTRFSF